MRIVGLTGLYCAGKNRVGALLEMRGFPVLDVDKLGHEAIRREHSAIVARFGHDILENGEVNRLRLGEKVFGKPDELAALEAIVHPAANALTNEWIAARSVDGYRLCVINAALLHKASVFACLDAVIVVKAALPVRLFRAKRRDGLSWRAILARFYSQRGIAREFHTQYFRQNADKRKEGVFIINNMGSNPQKQVDRLLPFLNSL